MSGFPNYDFQNQAGGPEEAGAGGPMPNQQQQQPPMGQPTDTSPGAFQAGGNGEPGSAGGPQQGGDAKTTLWWVTDLTLLALEQR